MSLQQRPDLGRDHQIKSEQHQKRGKKSPWKRISHSSVIKKLRFDEHNGCQLWEEILLLTNQTATSNKSLHMKSDASLTKVAKNHVTFLQNKCHTLTNIMSCSHRCHTLSQIFYHALPCTTSHSHRCIVIRAVIEKLQVVARFWNSGSLVKMIFRCARWWFWSECWNILLRLWLQ